MERRGSRPSAERPARLTCPRFGAQSKVSGRVTRAPGYLLVVEDGELEQQRSVRAAAGRRPPARSPMGIRGSRGTPCPGRSSSGGATLSPIPRARGVRRRNEAGRLDELRLSCLESRIEADLRLGGHARRHLARARAARRRPSAAGEPARPADASPYIGRSAGRRAGGVPDEQAAMMNSLDQSCAPARRRILEQQIRAGHSAWARPTTEPAYHSADRTVKITTAGS